MIKKLATTKNRILKSKREEKKISSLKCRLTNDQWFNKEKEEKKVMFSLNQLCTFFLFQYSSK